MSLDLFGSSIAAADQDVAANAAKFLPAELPETFDVAWRASTEFHNSVGYSIARSRALDDYSDQIFQKTGERLPVIGGGSGELQMYGVAGDTLDDFNAAQAKLKEKYPGLDYLTPLTENDIDAMAKRRMAKAHDDAAAMQSRETTWGGTLGTASGVLAGGFTDPVVLATLPLGGIGEAGVALRALEFAGISGGTEAAVAAASAGTREAAVPGSSKEIPGEILGATLFGGVLGAGFGLLGKLLKSGEKVLPTSAREELNAATSEAQLAATNPFPTVAGETAARDAVSDAVTATVRGDPVRSGENFDPAHVGAYAESQGVQTADELAARAEQHLRPETFGEAPDVERFDPLPGPFDDTASYWERRLDEATPEERRALGAEAYPDLPDLPEGANVTDLSRLGPVVEGLDDRWGDAVAWLKNAQTGDARAVLSHPAIDGRIDVIWGDESGGLAHILEKHPDVVPDLPERLAGMEVVSRSENRIRLSDGKSVAVIRRDLNGAQKDWLLTAFENDGRRGKGRTGSLVEADPAHSPDPSAGDNIGVSPASVDMAARDLSPDELVRLSDDPQLPSAMDHDVEHILAANPDAEFTQATRLDDGSYRLDTMKLSDVLKQLDAEEQAGKELLACAVGLEAME